MTEPVSSEEENNEEDDRSLYAAIVNVQGQIQDEKVGVYAADYKVVRHSLNFEELRLLVEALPAMTKKMAGKPHKPMMGGGE